MTKLTSKHQPRIVSSYTALPCPESTHRLLVLVSGGDADLTVTQRVWELAKATKSNIKFLGLCNDPMQESGLRRRLVTMSAMVNYDNSSAEIEIVMKKNWVDAVKSCCQPGDMIVCFEEQPARLTPKPLGQILQSDLNLPIYILSGPYSQGNSRSNWLTQAAAWIGFGAILLGFFILQINLYHLTNGWTSILILISIAVEFWLIWIWNNLFR